MIQNVRKSPCRDRDREPKVFKDIGLFVSNLSRLLNSLTCEPNPKMVLSDDLELP